MKHFIYCRFIEYFNEEMERIGEDSNIYIKIGSEINIKDKVYIISAITVSDFGKGSYYGMVKEKENSNESV